ncbi:hypothetical protein [Gordonia sp. MMO-8]|uniref:hypothetical protein n=1 Tax=Gordonia sp. MMO-8 TaxID=3127886 RepID=UPI003016BB29
MSSYSYIPVTLAFLGIAWVAATTNTTRWRRHPSLDAATLGALGLAIGSSGVGLMQAAIRLVPHSDFLVHLPQAAGVFMVLMASTKLAYPAACLSGQEGRMKGMVVQQSAQVTFTTLVVTCYPLSLLGGPQIEENAWLILAGGTAFGTLVITMYAVFQAMRWLADLKRMRRIGIFIATVALHVYAIAAIAAIAKPDGVKPQIIAAVALVTLFVSVPRRGPAEQYGLAA